MLWSDDEPKPATKLHIDLQDQDGEVLDSTEVWDGITGILGLPEKIHRLMAAKRFFEANMTG